jgi:hypothetical protein
MLESEKYWNIPSIYEYNIAKCTVTCWITTTKTNIQENGLTWFLEQFLKQWLGNNAWYLKWVIMCFFHYFLSYWNPIEKAIPSSVFPIISSSSFEVTVTDFLHRVRDRDLGSVFQASFVEEAIYSLMYVFVLLLRIRWLKLFGLISGSSSLSHWFICLFLCQTMLFLLLWLSSIIQNQVLW